MVHAFLYLALRSYYILDCHSCLYSSCKCSSVFLTNLVLDSLLHDKVCMEVDQALGSAIVKMYASCGRISTAMDLFLLNQGQNFSCMECMDTVLWNAWIRRCGSKDIFKFVSHLQPDGIKFVFIVCLQSCRYGGKTMGNFWKKGRLWSREK